jgi:hypothetical protein
MRGYGIVRVLTDGLSRRRNQCGEHNGVVMAACQALSYEIPNSYAADASRCTSSEVDASDIV